MKKSEIYRNAQKAVLNAVFMNDDDRLEILQRLYDDEYCARLTEEKTEEQGAAENG